MQMNSDKKHFKLFERKINRLLYHIEENSIIGFIIHNFYTVSLENVNIISIII